MTSAKSTDTARRLGVALAAALSTGVLIAAPAAGAEGGPRCSDFTDGTVTWNGSTVDVDAVLAAPACDRLTYTVYATTTDPESGQAVWTAVSEYTAAGSEISFAPLPLAASTTDTCDEFAWVYVTSATARGHVFDRAPDAGYFVLYDDPLCGPPGQFFH